MAQKLQRQQLKELGSKLEGPPASKDALIELLEQTANCLAEIDQSLSPLVLDSVQPCRNALAKKELLKHEDEDVKVLVVSCICEITRITAPEAPYSDDVLTDLFHVLVGTFAGLGDVNSPTFARRVIILETVARYRMCLMMLDLECNDLIHEMFSTFFSGLSDEHPQSVLASMQTVMSLILEEGEEIQENLLAVILSALDCKRNDLTLTARKLALSVIAQCAVKLEPSVKQLLVSSFSGDSSHLKPSYVHHELIYDIYQCAPQIVKEIVLYLTGELQTDKLDVRQKAVQLVGNLFALPELCISESLYTLFLEFLKRLTDRVVGIRVSVIEHLKNCLISNPSRPEASQIIESFSDQLFDCDENVRKQVISAIHDVACHSFDVLPARVVSQVMERLCDKSLSVKSYAMEKLADLFRVYCLKSSEGLASVDEYKCIPGRILRCVYDHDVSLEAIELIISGSLFPTSFTEKDKVKYWIILFSGFDKIEVKALDQILAQKQRLQLDMEKYLSLRQIHQEDDTETQKKLLGCFRSMSRCFDDPVKAEENFQLLNQSKDPNIWKTLTCLLDQSTALSQAWISRGDLLSSFGEKHLLYSFINILSLKCSYVLFNKEYIKEIFSEASAQLSGGDLNLICPCMNLLAVIARYSPRLLDGSEEELVNLLKEDNEATKEGTAHVLAEAGGNIREQLSTSSSSVELLLERLCLEGTRKQAKYAVQALAAISKDDGLKSLSVLYKRLVDMLEERTHLPAILQSLGCIAQIAMPIFETREEEITEFIKSKILNCSSDDDASLCKTEWTEKTELCVLKIFGIKTFVKSYLPAKDAHLRPGIEKLVQLLKNILSFGDFSHDVASSPVDKAHMRLASAKAVLRLSKIWDQKIRPDVFYATLRISEDVYPESRKLFLSKVHQFIKERVLDVKYACGFLFRITDGHSPDYEECKRYLHEIMQICHQDKVRQLPMQVDGNLAVGYPDYLLAYVVHAILHHPSCPSINESTAVQAFEPIYWRLHLFLSLLLCGDDGQQLSAFSTRRKESYAAVLSILHSIKHAKDAVDEAKSSTMHAICDLGLLVAKKMAHDQTNIPGIQTDIPLPCMLYEPVTPVNKVEDGTYVDNKQTWLCCDSAVAHFEALILKNKEEICSQVLKDNVILKDNDIDGNEVPLGKMMKILRSQGVTKKTKKKPVKKNELPLDLEKLEKEIDVLGVVREINLGNLERDISMDANKSTKNDEYHGISKSHATNDNENNMEFLKGKRDGTIAELVAPTPKRKRSRTMQRSPPTGERQNKKFKSPCSLFVNEKAHSSIGEKMLMEKDTKTANLDLLISCSPTTKGILSKTEKKGSDKLHIRKTNNMDLQKAVISDNSEKTANQLKDSNSSTRKRKVKSIFALEKCSSQNSQLTDTALVGSRIKVWWPLDKQFYDGVVQSYDSGKRKHKILYDDGDFEVLNLQKEKWELVPKPDIPKKKVKSQPAPPFKELPSTSTANKSNHIASRSTKEARKKSSSSKVGKKGTRNVLEDSKKRKLDNNTDADLSSPESSRGKSDISDVHSPLGSEVNDVNSDGSEEKELKLVLAGANKRSTMSKLLLKEENPDYSNLVDQIVSDDEPLNEWRLKSGKAT